MSNLNDYSFEDGAIKEIKILNDSVEVKYGLWNEKVIRLIFCEYWKLKDSNSIDIDISEITVSQDSYLIKEVIKDILDGDGSEKEAEGLNHYSFISSWGDRVIFEIVARNVDVIEDV